MERRKFGFSQLQKFTSLFIVQIVTALNAGISASNATRTRSTAKVLIAWQDPSKVCQVKNKCKSGSFSKAGLMYTIFKSSHIFAHHAVL